MKRPFQSSSANAKRVLLSNRDADICRHDRSNYRSATPSWGEMSNYPFWVALADANRQRGRLAWFYLISHLNCCRRWPWPRTVFLPFLPWWSSAAGKPDGRVSAVDCEGWVNVGISWKCCLKCVLLRLLPEVYLLLYLLSILLPPCNKPGSATNTSRKCFNFVCASASLLLPPFHFIWPTILTDWTELRRVSFPWPQILSVHESNSPANECYRACLQEKELWFTLIAVVSKGSSSSRREICNFIILDLQKKKELRRLF